jgi:hypothetical protein
LCVDAINSTFAHVSPFPILDRTARYPRREKEEKEEERGETERERGWRKRE